MFLKAWNESQVDKQSNGDEYLSNWLNVAFQFTVFPQSHKDTKSYQVPVHKVYRTSLKTFRGIQDYISNMTSVTLSSILYVYTILWKALQFHVVSTEKMGNFDFYRRASLLQQTQFPMATPKQDLWIWKEGPNKPNVEHFN